MSSLPVPFGGSAALTHWSVLCADGPDAARFLHGQLTQDIQTLGSDQARLAGYCSAKGRLLASFVVWRPEPEKVFLACHRSVAAATLKRLTMFVLRAKCALRDCTDSCFLQGSIGSTAEQATADAAVWDCIPSDRGVSIRLPDAEGQRRALRFVAPPAAAAEARATPSIALATWQWLEVQSGIATIEAATADQFVPQMLNFEQIGGVNFQKGCYPGQEVVARSQYRGTVKRRTLLFAIDAPAAPGDEVFSSLDATQPAGLVVNAAPTPDGSTYGALLEVKLSALEGGTLHLRSVDGAMCVQHALPYPLTLG